LHSLRLPAAASASAVLAVLTACGAGTPGQSAAGDACRAYANTGRQQGGDTVAEVDAVRATARADARLAAGADQSWTDLRTDIDEAFARERQLADATTDVRLLNAYFAADRQVEADCRSTGHEIGPLRP
jgi:hypothetical protein